MSPQVNEARSQWIKHLINFTRVWEEVAEAKKGKEAEYYFTRIVNIVQKLKKLDPQWQSKDSVSERNLIPIQNYNKNNCHTLQGA
jgi:LPS sulfotransferase NodH